MTPFVCLTNKEVCGGGAKVDKGDVAEMVGNKGREETEEIWLQYVELHALYSWLH